MAQHSLWAKTAGILYLLLSFFSVALLALWIESQISSIYEMRSLDDLFPTNEAKLLNATIATLFVASLAMGLSFFIRPRITRLRVVLCGLLSGIAFTCGIGAGLFWLLPGLFSFLAYREGIAANRSLY
jgi:hypothetical protein